MLLGYHIFLLAQITKGEKLTELTAYSASPILTHNIKEYLHAFYLG